MMNWLKLPKIMPSSVSLNTMQTGYPSKAHLHQWVRTLLLEVVLLISQDSYKAGTMKYKIMILTLTRVQLCAVTILRYVEHSCVG